MTSAVPSIVLLLLATVSTFAQGLAPSVKPDLKPDSRPAQALYEDANGYLGRKYQEFNKQKLPYDAKLEAQTKKEQKDLAVKNAATLQARSPLAGEDLYYLGLLHHLAGDADASLAAMRLFLKDDPGGQKAQSARNVVVLYAIKKDLVPEANAAVAAYARHQPQNADDRYRMELLITDAYMRAKDYASMATHAKEMLEASKKYIETNKEEVFRRDEMLLKSAVLLSDAYVKTNQRDLALATLTDLRRLSIQLPSASLYKNVTTRLMRLDPDAESGSTLRRRLSFKKSFAGACRRRVDRTAAGEADRFAWSGGVAGFLGAVVWSMPVHAAEHVALANDIQEQGIRDPGRDQVLWTRRWRGFGAA